MLSPLAFVCTFLAVSPCVNPPLILREDRELALYSSMAATALGAYKPNLVILRSWNMGRTCYEKSIEAHEMTHHIRYMKHLPVNQEEAYRVQQAYLEMCRNSYG